MKQQINLIKSKMLTFLVNVLCSKYLTPLITLMCAVLSFVAYFVLNQYIEAMTGSNIIVNGNFPDFTHLLDPVKGIFILFAIMGLAQLSQAIYPYKPKTDASNNRDKLFNLTCYAVTFYAVLFVITDILFVDLFILAPLGADIVLLCGVIGVFVIIVYPKYSKFSKPLRVCCLCSVLFAIAIVGVKLGASVLSCFIISGATCIIFGVLCFVWNKVKKKEE